MTTWKSALCLLGACLLSFKLLAADNLYTVVGAGYTKLDYAGQETDDSTYKLAIGYQFDRQWYIEMGYQQLSDQGFSQMAPETSEQADNFDAGSQGDSLYAALLGKAAGEMGELFYKIGVMKVDIKGQSIVAVDSNCSVGAPGLFQSASYQICEYDEGLAAGILGLGFDFYMLENVMIRTEVEYIKGQDDLETSALQMGVRYNF